jgi:hypothetical protein
MSIACCAVSFRRRFNYSLIDQPAPDHDAFVLATSGL